MMLITFLNYTVFRKKTSTHVISFYISMENVQISITFSVNV